MLMYPVEDCALSDLELKLKGAAFSHWPMAKKESASTLITVALVEDDARIRRQLLEILKSEEGIRCVGAYGSGEEAVETLPALQPKVVVMDVNLPGMDGVACVRALSGKLPGVQILMLTVRNDSEVIFNALSSGASGYLLKPMRAAEFLAAVRDVTMGGAPMSSFIARQVVQSIQQTPSAAPAAVEKLSAREMEVLEFLSHGFAYKEIADKLNIAYGTVHVHVARIYKKLHVQSRGQAVAKYLRGVS